jgi:uncharacterized membrane protein YfcA
VTWQLALTGLFIGVLVGMTGMGGGSLMTPILVLLFGFKPTLAIGTDIAHGAIFKTVGAIRHRRLGNVAARLSGWMLIGSAPASLLGVWLATWLEHRYGDSIESTSARVLGGALVFGCVGLLAKSLVRSKQVAPESFDLSTRDRVAAIVIGIVGGFVVGLTSVGTGVFFGLTLLVLFPLRAHKVVGTDIFHAAALLYVAGLGHFVAGNVDMSTVGWLLVGSIPGVLVGTQLTLSLPERPLRVVLAAVLGLAGLKLLDIPGSGAAIVVVLAAGMTGLLVWIAHAGWARRRARAEQLVFDQALTRPRTDAAGAGTRRSAAR